MEILPPPLLFTPVVSDGVDAPDFKVHLTLEEVSVLEARLMNTSSVPIFTDSNEFTDLLEPLFPKERAWNFLIISFKSDKLDSSKFGDTMASFIKRMIRGLHPFDDQSDDGVVADAIVVEEDDDDDDDDDDDFDKDSGM